MNEAELDAFLAAMRAGEGYKSALETFLRRLDPGEADRAMMLLKESRGAFGLLAVPGSGRALFVGDAMSGTPVALAALGFRVVVVAKSRARAEFALRRGAGGGRRTTSSPDPDGGDSSESSAGPRDVLAVVAGRDARLPFADRAFALVVHEDGLPGPATGAGFGADELRRVAADTLVVAADNRFGYKRSTGRRGHFVKHPFVLLREAVRPSRGERGLGGTRAAARGDWPAASAFALYPHAREFSHVVALDEAAPRLTVRRRERRNVLKLLGHRLGLFPLLTPSFAIAARREARPAPRRIDRLLAALAERLGEPRPRADVLVATRSNDAIVMTALEGRGEEDPLGRWTVHLPLQPSKRRMVEVHHDWLSRLRAEHPALPVPEPLFLGELEGLTASVERRLPGISGADVTGDRAATVRMLSEAAAAFTALAAGPAAVVDGARFDAVFGARTALAMRFVPGEPTRRALARLLAEARERIVGRAMPDAVYHADLRAKHVQVRRDGSLVGILDWGASEASFAPYVDVLHLVLHQRKQETGTSFRAAWDVVREPGRLRPYEAETLDAYCRTIRLDPEVRRGIEQLYPALAAGMAERNWDYSRPDWVHRQFLL